MAEVGPRGLDLVETELSPELCRWGQSPVVTPPLVRSLGFVRVGWRFKAPLLRPKKMASWGREGCQELGSWHSLVVVTPTSWASGSMPLPNPKGY